MRHLAIDRSWVRLGVVLDNNILYQGNVVSMQAVEQGSFIKRFVDWITLLFSNMFSG